MRKVINNCDLIIIMTGVISYMLFFVGQVPIQSVCNLLRIGRVYPKKFILKSEKKNEEVTKSIT